MFQYRNLSLNPSLSSLLSTYYSLLLYSPLGRIGVTRFELATSWSRKNEFTTKMFPETNASYCKRFTCDRLIKFSAGREFVLCSADSSRIVVKDFEHLANSLAGRLSDIAIPTTALPAHPAPLPNRARLKF